jgi:hexosaminidase
VEHSVIPVPVSVEAAAGAWFALTPTTRVLAPPGHARAGELLAGPLRAATGHPLPVADAGDPGDGAIRLRLAGDAALGEEGYQLEVAEASVTLRAATPAGLFRGAQTVRQLLPTQAPWRLPGGRVADRPRFAWRGVALDVARHFFTVEQVERYLDLLALYKLNVLHLHLTDDQGWRIAVDGWPRLATVGGATQVGGGPGGCYTREDWSRIVGYARDRHVTVVPEVDVPGHSHAALAAYPELSCDGRAAEPYTGTAVGFSCLCVDEPVTWRFLDEVLGELAERTPGPWLHVGGDEVKLLDRRRYAAFVERVGLLVARHGKQAVGWQETAAAGAPPPVVQLWKPGPAPAAVRRAVRRESRLLLSPADRVYLDMKYDPATPLGLEWAGHVEVRDAYQWEPSALAEGVEGGAVLGVEAALWSETLRGLGDAELMTLPRLPGIAEVAWSPAGTRDWEGYRRRLAAHGPRWSAMGRRWHRSPQVPWPG